MLQIATSFSFLRLNFIKLKYFDFSIASSMQADATWVNYTSASLFSLETSGWSVKHTTSWEPKRIYPMKEQAVPGCILEQLFINKA